MKDDTALLVKNVHKDFKLPHEKVTSLKEKIIHFNRQKTYEKHHALRDINFEVKKGDFFGIVGRNGSGKSTLLKIIGGIYQPTKGSIEVNGTLTPFIELGIGFNAELTGRENVFLNGAILGLSNKEIKQKYHEIVEFAELEKFMDQKLKNYSSGMQVRLAFSIAIQAHNDILLIDEVLAVGDASFQRKCYNVFKEIKQSGKTVVFVTHDMGAVREYCNKAILIEKGKITSEGDPNIVANDYLQLFNEDASAKGKKSSAKRWGDFNIKASDPDIQIGDKYLMINYKLTAEKDAQDPIIGIIIKDLDTNHIYDNNTKWMNVETGLIKRGQTLNIEWRVPNVFKSGRYKLTIATAHHDALGFYDWNDEAAFFDVNRKEITAGLVVLDDGVLIKKA